MDMTQWQRLIIAALLGLVIAWIAARKNRHSIEWGIAATIGIAILGEDIFFIFMVLLFLLRPICPHCQIPLQRQHHNLRYRCQRCGYIRPLPLSKIKFSQRRH